MGDYLNSLFTLSSPKIDSAKDLLDMTKLIRSSGQMIGGMTPMLATQALVATLTQGASIPTQLLLQGGIGFTLETMQNAGGAYEDKFAETGNVAAAEKAAQMQIEGNSYLLPLYALDGLPFISEATLGIKNILLRGLAKGGVETLTELPQEYFQGIFEDLARDNKGLSDISEKMTLERLEDTALNIIPSTFAMGAIPTYAGGVSKYVKDVNTKAFAAKQDLHRMSTTALQQYLYGITLQRGESFAKAYLSGLQQNGSLKNVDLEQVASVINTAQQVVRDAAKFNLSKGKSKVYSYFMLNKQIAQTDLENAETLSVQKAAEARLKMYEEAAVNFLTNGKGDFAVIKLANNEQYVASFQEIKNMLEDPRFSAKLAKGEIEITLEKDKQASEFAALTEQIKQTKDAIKTKDEVGSGDTSARTDNTGAEVGDIASVTDKGESGKEVVAETEVVPALRDVESTAKAFDKLETSKSKEFSDLEDMFIDAGLTSGEYDNNTLSEAYHKAKKDGSNPELVKAVEELLSKEQTPTKEVKPSEVVSPAEIEAGRQEVSAVKKGKINTTKPIRLFKGLFGKRNPDGTRKSAHPNVKGVFSAVDEKIAERYRGEDGVGTFDIPAGTTIEVIKIENKKVPIPEFRKEETAAINASDAQVVKLITIDARGAEEQYIIKDPALIEKMQKPESQEVAKEQKEEVKEQKVSEAEVPPALRDVESTAKALKPIVNKRKESIGVKLRNLIGLISHNGSESITKFDPSKVKGQSRGRYGKGFYFSSLFKNFDYGDKSTFLDSSKLNLLDADMPLARVFYELLLPTKINSRINKLNELLSKSKNNAEYNEISKEIDRLEEMRSSFDKNSNYIEKALEKAIEENPEQDFSSFLESLESKVIASNKLNPSVAVKGLEDSLNNLLLNSGFDGFSVTGGYEILVIPQEKLNDLIVPSQEKAISEAYHKAKADGSNPELVKAVEELLSKEQKKDIKKQEFPENVLDIAKETGLSPQQVQNTYKKYDGSKNIEEITIEDYKNARATGDKTKLEVSAKAFDALLQQENAKTSTSPTAKKNAEKSLKEADEKAIKEASKIMEHINEIRAKIQESGIIESTSCKWGK
jgi:hypothetical protein